MSLPLFQPGPNRSDRRGAAAGTLHGLHFYRFPADPTQRTLWIKAARRWDLLKTNPGPNRRVCSAHFITGTSHPRFTCYINQIKSN
uniref:THAP-type domain-containing protein n=1 Tax=Periophthalmus magnuspinnatus TaxID=409849 RepID=A0A3B4A159_9GOBI